MKKWILVILVLVVLISGCSTGAQLDPTYSFKVHTEVVEPINGREYRLEVFENGVSISTWGILSFEIEEGFYKIECNDDAPEISINYDFEKEIVIVSINKKEFEVDIFKK